MSVTIIPSVATPDAPRLLWPRTPVDSVSATTAAPLYDAAFAVEPQTYSAWRPTALPATITLNFSTDTEVDAIGIGCHTLGSSGASVLIEYLVGASTWTELTTLTPNTDDAILVLFPAVTETSWRFTVSGSVVPEIGNIVPGKALSLPRNAQFAPALPITDAETFRYDVNRTATGSWAGRSLRSSGLSFEITVNNLSETFVAGDDWQAFRAHVNKGAATFYAAPKPASYPKEVAYAWCPGTLRLQRNRAQKDISRALRLECEGYLAP